MYSKDGGNNHMGYAHGKERGIYYMAVDGGKATLVQERGASPYSMLLLTASSSQAAKAISMLSRV
ncbi:hypothetical protein GCM10028895_45070 [Pontibacter rugosus]